MQHRMTDQVVLDEADISDWIAAGDDVIVQYSKPIYTPELLSVLERLCRKLGERLQVRFFGHYQSCFDCSILTGIPSVSSLAVDCLKSVSHPETIHELGNLHSLSLGIYELADTEFLNSTNFKILQALRIGETRRKSLNLAPIANMRMLNKLHISGHARNIEAVGRLPALDTLSLSMINKSVNLAFINQLKLLRCCRLMLGGRLDIKEVSHGGIQSLEIIRVRGFAHFDPDAFPGLINLQVEDQVRLTSIAFSKASSELRRLVLLNCKGLSEIGGLSLLRNLHEARIIRTAIDLDDLISRGLPSDLRIFAFGTGKMRADRGIKERLEQMGYGRGGRGQEPFPSVIFNW